MTARRAVLRGRVQGVGFRFFAERVAHELGVRGWVRNLPDGSVETVAEGEEQLVERYIERLRAGPRASRVEAVWIEELDSQGFRSFEITG